jgi:PAS domain S-box-containing protein
VADSLMRKDPRILVAEDSQDDLLLLEHEIKKGGWEPFIRRVETAEEMKQALLEDRWDIIISDYIMPRFGGLEALEVLKATGLDIPFIILSGKIGEDIAVEAMKAGAHDYIVKGNLGRLMPAVERELRDAEVRAKRKAAEEELRRYHERLGELVEERTAELRLANEQLQQEIAERRIAEEALWKAVSRAEEEKAKTEAIIAAMGDGVMIQDTNYRILYQNKIHRDIIGDHAGNYCYKAYYNYDRICDDCPVHEAFKDKSIHHAEKVVANARGIFHVEITASPLKDADGNVVAGIEIVRDITARKNMEEELREHRDHLDLLVRERTVELRKVNKELRAEIMRRIQMEKDLMESQRFVQRIADATPNLLYLYDVVENRNVYINPRVQEILGYSPEAIKKAGNFFFQAFGHPEDLNIIESLGDRFGSANDGDIVESEYRVKNAAGQWRWFHGRSVVFKRTSDGILKLVLGIAQDITERKEAEEELKNSREQLRYLLAHLQSVREDERTRISREIHDELGQALTALKMDLSWLAKRLERDQKPLRDKAHLMSKLIDMNIQTVKRISAELRPGLLDDLGLTAALEWQLEEFQERTGIKCEISISPEDIALSREISTTIFRVFQETLTNIVRHAKAKRVRVSLKERKGEVILQVRDDGKGITKSQVSSPKSIGLMGIRERLGFLGGNVKFSGTKDKGTAVTVTIPVGSSV